MHRLRREKILLTIALMFSLTMHLIYGIEGAAQMGVMEQKLQRQAAQLKGQARADRSIRDYVGATRDRRYRRA